VSDLAVRRAEPEDVPAIAGLFIEVADEIVAREPSLRHVPPEAAVVRRYESRIADPDCAVLVAVAGGAVIGFADAALQRQEEDATYDLPGVSVYVEQLIVTAAHRRRGAASMLMRSVEAWGREAGARAVALDTHVTNTDARALYAILGYREAGVILLREV
jgi:GNAT superfamily N-acetyltransferase